MAEWFYTSNRQQLGPVSFPELKELATVRILRPQDLVWKEGMPDWVKASTLPELFTSSAATSTSSSRRSDPEDRPRKSSAKTEEDGDWGTSSKTLDGEDADLDSYKPGRRSPRKSEYDDDDDDRPTRSRSTRESRLDDDEDRPSRRRSREVDDDNDDDEAPRRRRRRSQKSSNGMLIGILAAVGGVVAIVLIVILVIAFGKETGSRSFRLAQGANTWWNISFKANERVEIRVNSTGQSDVDLYVFDASGNQVTFDDGDSKDCFVVFTPRSAQRFKVEVRNMVRIDQPGRNGSNSGTVTFKQLPGNVAQGPAPPVPMPNPNPNPNPFKPPVVKPPVNPPNKFPPDPPFINQPGLPFMAKTPPNQPDNKKEIVTPLGAGPITANGALVQGDPQDVRHRNAFFKVFTYNMTAGTTYTIDLEGPFDPYLRLEDPNRVGLLENDDFNGLNSRIVYTPTQTGAHRIIVTSLSAGRIGNFTLKISP